MVTLTVETTDENLLRIVIPIADELESLDDSDLFDLLYGDAYSVMEDLFEYSSNRDAQEIIRYTEIANNYSNAAVSYDVSLTNPSALYEWVKENRPVVWAQFVSEGGNA
jgi:hypothetical protein